MNSLEAKIYRSLRQAHPDKQTLGELYLYDGDELLFVCKTLELPDRDNHVGVSRIPAGTYEVSIRWSKKFGKHFHINDVQGRSYILIHVGNYYTQIRGCILVGKEIRDINGDGVFDVTSSKKTMDKLLKLANRGFTLTIENDC